MTHADDVLARAVLGDAGAFEALATEYRPVAFRTALSILGERDLADDVSQDALIRLRTALPGFRGDADLSTWVYRVALNLSYDLLRRRKRIPSGPPIEELREVPAGEENDPHATIDAERARRAVNAAIDRLPEALRDPIRLRFVVGMSYRETALALGLPEGTVASRIYRALKRLGSDLETKHLEILR